MVGLLKIESKMWWIYKTLKIRFNFELSNMGTCSPLYDDFEVLKLRFFAEISEKQFRIFQSFTKLLGRKQIILSCEAVDRCKKRRFLLLTSQTLSHTNNLSFIWEFSWSRRSLMYFLQLDRASSICMSLSQKICWKLFLKSQTY